MATTVDCLIVGGGPAGLTAAIYLSRFRLSVLLVDSGASRAALIPCTRNHAGYPGGIAGIELLVLMRRQAIECGAKVSHGSVTRIEYREGMFLAETATDLIVAKAVILATGVTNRSPEMPQAMSAAALSSGRLRYCPVCDGFEVTDQNVAVIGSGVHGLREALFLRSFTAQISMISPCGPHEFEADEVNALDQAGIARIDGPVTDFQLEADGLSFSAGGERLCFEAVYPALGSDIHSDLARSLGADLTDLGCIVVDAHQRSSIPGLYAAGDVVIGLDQISHAMGEAGVAATALRNDLDAKTPLRR